MKAGELVNRISKKTRRIFREFQSKEFRDAYVESQINDTLAFQVRAMRKERGWSQNELATLTSTRQSAISRMENPDYGQFNIETLKKLASVFDVALMVRFVSFSELANRAAKLTIEDLNIQSYKDDHGLQGYSAFDSDDRVSNFTVSNWSTQGSTRSAKPDEFNIESRAANYG